MSKTRITPAVPTEEDIEKFMKDIKAVEFEMNLIQFKMRDIVKTMISADKKLEKLMDSAMFSGLPPEFKKQILQMREDTNEIKSKL